MGIFCRRQYVEKDAFATAIKNLSISLESLREDYMFGSLSQLKREGIDVSRVRRDIVPESELEDILKGFQLTSMMGIAWNYIRDGRDQLDFDKLLSSHLGAQDGSRAWRYRDNYVDCQGDFEALSKSLAIDIHRAIGLPEPRIEYLIQFSAGAQILISMCQMATYTAFGDDKMVRTLKKRIGMPL